MASYEGFRRDSNLSPAGIVGSMGTPSPGAGPIHNMPGMRHPSNKGGRLNVMNVNLDGQGGQGYYHQTPPPPPLAPPASQQLGHGTGAGYYGRGSGNGHNQIGSNEYYGKYEIEFNHHNQNNHHHSHQGQIKPGAHLEHTHGPLQQTPGGFGFNSKSAGVQFNGPSAAYYNNNGVAGGHGVEGTDIHPPGPHAPYQQQTQQQQQQQAQQAQFHHQTYHVHNNNFDEASYYHHHHHHHHGHGHGHGPGNKVGNNFYEANNNSIAYQQEYGEMGFPNSAATVSPMNHPHHQHHPGMAPGSGGAGSLATGGHSSVEGATVFVQPGQAMSYGFEGAAHHVAGHPNHPHHPQHPQQAAVPGPGMQGELEWDYGAGMI